MRKTEFNPVNMMIDFEQGFNCLGLSLYSEDFAARLLAWFHAVGGNNEAVVLNPALCAALRICGAKLGMEGGRCPSAEQLELFKRYSSEIKLATEMPEPVFPEWLFPLLERYKLPVPRVGIDFIGKTMENKNNEQK